MRFWAKNDKNKSLAIATAIESVASLFMPENLTRSFISLIYFAV
jgi:hypothetical protein